MSNRNKKQHAERGEQAKAPLEIPKSGWKDILLRVKNQIAVDHVQIVSAGVAFYFFLSIFPILSVFLSVYGLLADSTQIESQLTSVLGALPSDAAKMMNNIIIDMLSQSDSTLGWSLLIGLVLSLWSANSGTSTLFEGINIAYDETNNRSFIRKTAITLSFTVGILFIIGICLFIMIGLPALVTKIESGFIQNTIFILRWIVLAFMVSFSLAILYKIAPDRDNPEFRWVSWGGSIATILWILGSWLFAFYIENYAGYTETYGNLAAVVIALLWLFLTAFIILLGAEINSEMEHQTAEDTTIGEDEPIGNRGAYHADHVAAGESETETQQSKRRGDKNN